MTFETKHAKKTKNLSKMTLTFGGAGAFGVFGVDKELFTELVFTPNVFPVAFNDEFAFELQTK